jgi:ATP-citrate lyase beta-subunit
MSQIAIREYDAKTLFAHYTNTDYDGYIIDTTQNNRSEQFLNSIIAKSKKLLVVKPDMLFGKRGKYWLVATKYNAMQVVDRVWEKSLSSTTINNKNGQLHIFLVEYFIPHTDEYYIALKNDTKYDMLLRSKNGGMDIEEKWNQIEQIKLPLMDDDIQRHISKHHIPANIQWYVTQIIHFFRDCGFVYLEINPFCFDSKNQIINLDMVAKVDSCEKYKQDNRKYITRTKPFWEKRYPCEEIIQSLDENTGASLKLSIINPKWTIRLLLWGGGASVVTLDTLTNAWLLDHVSNYGELSGNPSYEDNKIYIEQILLMMSKNVATKQYLCMIWGIANFTRIDHLCQAFVTVLEENIDIVKSKNIHIICRRGWVNDIEGLQLVKDFAEKNNIPCEVFDGSTYLTGWVWKIVL